MYQKLQNHFQPASRQLQNVSLDKVHGHYISTHLPQRMGNSASNRLQRLRRGPRHPRHMQTAPAGFQLYSAMGHYLRAVSTEENLLCTPIQLRKIKNFVTYRVGVEQRFPATSELRLCTELPVDFHMDEPSVLEYSARSTRKYSRGKR